MGEIKLPGQMLELVARRFRCLGEPFRLRILQSLSITEKTVTELVQDLDANQPNVSKHLNILLEGGLVERKKQGTSSLYSIADPMIFTLCDLVCRSVVARTEAQLGGLQATGQRTRRAERNMGAARVV